MKWLVGSAIAALLASDVLAQPAEVIVVRDSTAVANCLRLGEVRASSMMGGLWANAGYDKTVRQLKDRAAELGGTHVQVIDSASGHSGSRMMGAAFQCASTATAAKHTPLSPPPQASHEPPPSK